MENFRLGDLTEKGWVGGVLEIQAARGCYAGSMLGQRRRRWPGIDPALRPRAALAGIVCPALCHWLFPYNPVGPYAGVSGTSKWWSSSPCGQARQTSSQPAFPRNGHIFQHYDPLTMANMVDITHQPSHRARTRALANTLTAHKLFREIKAVSAPKTLLCIFLIFNSEFYN